MTDRRAIAEAFARRLKERYGDRVDRVLLFGSVARGDAREDSDVDLLVVTGGDWFALQVDLSGDVIDLLLRTGIYLSVQVYGRSDYERVRATGLGRALAIEGIPLA